MAAPGFAPYQGEIAKGAQPQVVRIGLLPAQAELAAVLHGRVIRSEGDERHLWVDLQPVYETAWPLRTLNNTAVKNDGGFAFADIQPGLYTLLMYGDRTVPEDTLFYEAPYELLHAQVVRVEGETDVEVRLDAADEPAPSTLRNP